MKKLMYVFILILCVSCFTGCTKEENIEGDLSDLMGKLYEGIPEEMVNRLMQTELTKENEEAFIGATGLKYKEALASEPAMTSIAHSVVLIRMENIKDVEETKKEIKEKVNPRKWICVEVEEKNVLVESRGNLIALIMDNENANTIKDNFYKLK